MLLTILTVHAFTREANISAQCSAALRADIAHCIYLIVITIVFVSFRSLELRNDCYDSLARKGYISVQHSAALRADIAYFIISTAELES